MSTQKALFITEKQGPFKVDTKGIQKPSANQVLVKIEATALNPVDWKIQAFDFAVETYPAIVGADAAGVVVEVGTDVTGFAKGDKVLFQGLYNNDEATFQQYAVVVAEITAKIPENLPFDQASSIPLTLATAVIGLYNDKPGGLGLPQPWTSEGRGKYAGQPFFVYGASSSVGQFAVQAAKLSGFSPILATASLSNADLLKSLGATHVFDRHLSVSALADEVKKAAGAPIKYAYDAISLPETQQLTYDILAPGGSFVIVLNKNVKEEAGKDVNVTHVYGNFHPPQNRKLGVSLYSELTNLLKEGSIKPNPTEVLPSGLAGIPAGLKRLQENKVSGKKLIAHPQETA